MTFTGDLKTVPQSERDPAKVVFALRQTSEKVTEVVNTLTGGSGFPIEVSIGGQTVEPPYQITPICHGGGNRGNIFHQWCRE